MSEIALFEQKEIRRVWQDEEWYFSVSDVVKALTDSTDPKQYIKKMRARDPELSNNWGTICTPVQMIAADGKQRKIQAANSEGLLRIIQSIPSPKAEPFKRWLAAIGAERIREIADPEIAALRAQDLYRKKGYPIKFLKTSVVLRNCRLAKNPRGERERAEALSRFNRPRRRVRRGRGDFCGGKSHFPEQKSFPCSFRARKSVGF